MLYIIGTGLNDIKDLTLRALDALKASTHIFIDTYTSISNLNIKSLEQLIPNTPIHECCREYIESLNELYSLASNHTVSLLIIGTPFFATTHTQIVCDCIENNIEYQVIHNAGICNVMGCVGLYSYSFGRTVSIPRSTLNTRFTSFFDNIKVNYESKMHTLCLLDIKTCDEYYMTPGEAVGQILECGEYFERGYKIFVISRFGCSDEVVRYVELDKVASLTYGEPLHSLILPAALEVYEKEAIDIMFGNK